jgi:3-oxoacyl-[acyl-carrier protein] reductase
MTQREQRHSLEGKVAVVTGGAGGIGRAIATALSSAGADVVITYLTSRDAAQEIVDRLESSERRGSAVQLDQRDPSSIQTAAATVLAEYGRVDILVNNAGWNISIPFADLDSLTPDIWDRLLETNLRGPFLVTRAFAQYLRQHRVGRVINISSLGGIYPGSSSIAYSVSKAGLIHLTRCLAVALAPDATVNSIAPGVVEGTNMACKRPPERNAWLLSQLVLGRFCSADDIAQQVVVFALAESVTGQVMVIDGGMPAGMR